MSNLLRTIEHMSANLGPPTEETVLEMKKRLTDFCYPALAMPPPEVAKLRDFLIREQSRSNVMISRLMLVARQQQLQILNLESRTIAGRWRRFLRLFKKPKAVEPPKAPANPSVKIVMPQPTTDLNVKHRGLVQP